MLSTFDWKGRHQGIRYECNSGGRGPRLANLVMLIEVENIHIGCRLNIPTASSIFRYTHSIPLKTLANLYAL